MTSSRCRTDTALMYYCSNSDDNCVCVCADCDVSVLAYLSSNSVAEMWSPHVFDHKHRVSYSHTYPYIQTNQTCLCNIEVKCCKVLILMVHPIIYITVRTKCCKFNKDMYLVAINSGIYYPD